MEILQVSKEECSQRIENKNKLKLSKHGELEDKWNNIFGALKEKYLQPRMQNNYTPFLKEILEDMLHQNRKRRTWHPESKSVHTLGSQREFPD